MTASRNAKIVLSDGKVFAGKSFGYEANTTGELCFHTGMVGYPESLTDPSYCGQILVFTFPIMGSYGVPAEEEPDQTLPAHFESDKIQVRAMICSSTHKGSHYTMSMELGDWLKEHKVPGLYEVDTRALTQYIRNEGAQMASIVIEDAQEDLHTSLEDVNLSNLVAGVTCQEPKEYYNFTAEDYDPLLPVVRLVAVDCGMKRNILRLFLGVSRGVCQLQITVVPWDTEFCKMDFDGLFLSNGPGNPEVLTSLIAETRQCMELGRPIFGICLGNQILALAASAKTFKMKFGHRGNNQPVMDMRTARTYISSQNHGYAVDNASLPSDWMPFFTNVNDSTNEGLMHISKPWSAVQFHPEGRAGPNDTSYLFKEFLERCANPNYFRAYTVPFSMPDRPKKVLVLGSGGLSIGQAGEFDYSGSQCLKALRENNVQTILVNSNIATVQTSAGLADRVYFLPTTPEFVRKVIKKERPAGIMCTFGGQTALNCAIQLDRDGTLAEFGVQVMGTPIKTIEMTEDREMFAQKLAEIEECCARSETASDLPGALVAANTIGYPVLVRSAFTLGGLGSGFANDDEELKALCEDAFQLSDQVIIDQSLRGWKEVEYEVVRDRKGNCITVCNMENFDPLGIHTGDSIVVAPTVTLNNAEVNMLRDTSLKVIGHLGVVGECNIQFALNPNSSEYVIVEVNARLSRSSALASKATGYPLAYVAAQLALGYDLPTLRNKVTLTTTACFEPALDYIVTKVPRWDLKKFEHVGLDLGSSMKSVGEVMAIGRNWRESLQKALRMVTDNQVDGFACPPDLREPFESGDAAKDRIALEGALRNPTCDRVWLMPLALEKGFTVDELHSLTKIDRWFLLDLEEIQKQKLEIAEIGGVENLSHLTHDKLLRFKRSGFSDKQIGGILGTDEHTVRGHRVDVLGIRPYVKQIDTVAGEHPAQTNYLYLTYDGTEHDVPSMVRQSPMELPPLTPVGGQAPRTASPATMVRAGSRAVIVLGCGCYRIGSSVEFDWSSMSCVTALRKNSHQAIVINANPETVSTDYDESDRLYFEDSGHLETVLDICEYETPKGVIVSVGGQTPNNIAVKLKRYSVPILGTSAASIDRAEDRGQFSELCDLIGVDQPAWSAFSDLTDAYRFCERVGFPVLVRPSYVLSGAAMSVVYRRQELEHLLRTAAFVSPDHPVVISKYIEGAKEVEMDAVADAGKIVIYAISEHVENAGVHSGDASLILPAQKLYTETITRVRRTSAKIAAALNITGPFNIQYMCRDNEVKVIECNLRASRTFPFISKTFNRNFIEIATNVMLGIPCPPVAFNIIDIDYVGVKCPMFSFTRLRGADPRLGVEMQSTGEVACYGYNKHEAFLKAFIAANQNMKSISGLASIILSVGPGAAKDEMMLWVRCLIEMKLTVFCTTKTYRHIMIDAESHGIAPMIFQKHFKLCAKPDEAKTDEVPDALELIAQNKVGLVIDIPGIPGRDGALASTREGHSAGYLMRRAASDGGVPLVTDIKHTTMFVEALHRKCTREAAGKEFWDIRSWNEIISSAAAVPALAALPKTL